MPRRSQVHRHPMQVVARRTGLTAELLRVWERRYDVVKPARTRTGRRLYADDEVERLSLLYRATLGGRSIGQVAPLTNAALEELIRQDAAAELANTATARRDDPEPAIGLVRAALKAVERFDVTTLDAVLARASFALPATAVLDDVITPLLRQVGARAHDGTLRPVHGNVLAIAIRRILERAISEPRATTQRLVVATPDGVSSDSGALMLAAAAAAEGWAVTWIGTGVSPEDVVLAARSARARAVVLSVATQSGDGAIAAELRRLRSLLPRAIGVVVGGVSSGGLVDVLKDIGAASCSDSRAFTAWLRAAPSRPRTRSARTARSTHRKSTPDQGEQS